MKFTIENIGPIKKSEMEFGALTILWGKNNTGKTYITYNTFNFIAAVTGFSLETSSVFYDETIDAYDTFKKWAQQLGQDRINKINEALNE